MENFSGEEAASMKTPKIQGRHHYCPWKRKEDRLTNQEYKLQVNCIRRPYSSAEETISYVPLIQHLSATLVSHITPQPSTYEGLPPYPKTQVRVV